MALTASKRFMNWSGVTFTPAGTNTATTFTGVTSVAINAGGSLAKFSGDGDRWMTTVVNDMNDPTITVQSADLGAIRANPAGTFGTFVATHNDARNLTLTGAITYTVVNAVVQAPDIQGAHRQYGQGTLVLGAYSPDGQTSPLALTVAT